MITVMNDHGVPLKYLDEFLYLARGHVTHAKISYGLAKILPDMPARLRLYRTHGISAYPGGTLFEYHFHRREAALYFDWIQEQGFAWVEIADGTKQIPRNGKLGAIAEAVRRGLHVVSEVGMKDPSKTYPNDRWHDFAKADLDSGAVYVTLEGRESGRAGIYDSHGQVHMGLLGRMAPMAEQLIFEAPLTSQQVMLIHEFGPGVNLGNITPEHVLPLAALRQGLRAETLGKG